MIRIATFSRLATLLIIFAIAAISMYAFDASQPAAIAELSLFGQPPGRRRVMSYAAVR
jgi:hypothetical protein